LLYRPGLYNQLFVIKVAVCTLSPCGVFNVVNGSVSAN